MPTYDYVCDACDHKFELFQSITAEAEKKCPQCKKNKLRRLIGGGAAILFKGSGFYQTDYRSESYKQKAAAEGKTSSGESKGSDSSTSEGKSSSDKPASTSSSSETKPKSKSKDK